MIIASLRRRLERLRGIVLVGVILGFAAAQYAGLVHAASHLRADGIASHSAVCSGCVAATETGGALTHIIVVPRLMALSPAIACDPMSPFQGVEPSYAFRSRAPPAAFS